MKPANTVMLLIVGIAVSNVLAQNATITGTSDVSASRMETSVAVAPTPQEGDQGDDPPIELLLDNDSSKIGFQALLTNGMGGPIANPNGQHELDFRLYASDAGGIAIGEVLDVLVTLDGGVASTQVGPMDPTWFDGSARWMGVTVDNGTELTPLIPLGSVPYAFRVDRVASAELDDNIELGDIATSGSLTVFSGDVEPETITLDGAAGQATIGSPSTQAEFILHGTGPLMETRDAAGTLVSLYGYDAFGGGAALLMSTAGGTTGLLLDGQVNGGDGGAVQLFNNAAEEAISLTAADATIRAGSLSGGVGGHIHLYPSAGGPSFIHLDGNSADVRIGVSAIASGNLSLYDVSGGASTIDLRGGSGELVATNGTNDTVIVDGMGSGNGGAISLRNSSGVTRLSLTGSSADVDSSGMPLSLNSGSNQNVLLATGGGRVGIGTTSPNHELVIQGDDPAMTIRDDTTDNSANAARIELLERSGGNYDGGAFLWWNGADNKFFVGTKQGGVNTNVLVIDRATSSVGIGTQSPAGYRLAVNGAIRSKEIVVETGWSDFVFEPGYDLPTLEDYEAHISEHGHLPDIPSAANVAKHGVKVGEMESKLLQKVEELTLHMIQMNKRIGELECENAELRGL